MVRRHREVSGEEIAEAFAPLRECVIRHVEQIAPIMLCGNIALVALEPSAAWRATLRLAPEVVEVALEMPSELRENLIANGDSVTARWCRSDRDGRLFAIWRESTLLLNFQDGVWSPEPGSLDSEAS